MKKTFGLAAAAVLTLTLTACGDDDGGSGGGGFDEAAYCDAFRDANEQFDDLQNFDTEALADVENTVNEMSDQAPEDLKDEWGQLQGFFSDMRSALEDAGLSLDDLDTLGQGELPEGLDPSKLEELGTKMQELTENSELEDATNAIREDAETRCDIPAEGGES